MEEIFKNKFTDQHVLTHDFLVPEISEYLKLHEKEIEVRKAVNLFDDTNGTNGKSMLNPGKELSQSRSRKEKTLEDTDSNQSQKNSLQVATQVNLLQAGPHEENERD